MDWERIGQGYVGAVSVSLSVALGLGRVVRNSTHWRPIVRRNIQRFVPYTAVALAGIANVFLMRWNECREGIVVEDELGGQHGHSRVAGITACGQVAFSRCVTSLPVLTVPPLAMAYLERRPLLMRNPRLALPINLAIITTMLLTALPAAIAIFPQRASLRVRHLEQRFHSLVDAHGKPVDRVYFNRGL